MGDTKRGRRVLSGTVSCRQTSLAVYKFGLEAETTDICPVEVSQESDKQSLRCKRINLSFFMRKSVDTNVEGVYN